MITQYHHLKFFLRSFCSAMLVRKLSIIVCPSVLFPVFFSESEAAEGLLDVFATCWGAPQLSQNLASSGSFAPHFVQNFIVVPFL